MKNEVLVRSGLAIALVVLSAVGAYASPPLIPSTGIDFEGMVSEAVVVIGTCVLAIVGAYFAFKAVKVALRWAGKIGG